MKDKVKNDLNTDELVSFFDLLAKFDYEDKKQSPLSTVTLVSAPKVTVLSVDNKKTYGAERARKKNTKK